MDLSPARGALSYLRRTVYGPDYPRYRPLARWPRLARIAAPLGLPVLLGLCAINVADLTGRERELPFPSAVLISIVTVAPLAALLHRPLLAWRLTIVALFAGTFNAAPGAPWPWSPLLVLGALAVLVAVALRADRGVLVWIGLISVVPVVWFVDINNLGGALFLLVAVLLVGDQIQRRRQTQRALVEQAELSELEKARRAVLEERARIARELHDVVAHHMSMIAVQAETAPYRLDALPEPAGAEFRAIAGSAREALTDMRRLLGVLRSESNGPQTAPQPGLADLPDLLEAARRAGMSVDLDAGAGDDAVPPAPPAAVGLAAYRIVQEALANAARHAPGAPVRVSVRPGPRELAIRVENHPPAGTGPAGIDPIGPAGHGLTGMRERATLLGGEFAAGPTEHGFAVSARLPYDAEDTR